MICNVCGINEGRSYTRKNKEGKLITIFQPICKQCLANKSHHFPEHITKEFLEHEHIVLNKSASQIAKENNTSEKKISGRLECFGIKEILHCKYCDTTENLITRVINNQFNKPTVVTQKICYKCHKETQGKTVSETRKNESLEKKKQRRENTKKYYKENPEQKKQETEKKMQTVNNWTEEQKKEHRDKISETKQNRTEEQEKERIEKFKQTMSEKTDEEKQERLKKMGKGVKNYLLNRTKEEIKDFNDKKFATLIKNDSFYRSNSWENTSQSFFSIIHEFLIQLNINYSNLYYSAFNTEKGIYVGDVDLSDNKFRMFDFYVKINDKYFNIEFDEPYHDKRKSKDLIREQEILIKKPLLNIIRIKEKDYLNNPIKVILDILNILQGGENKEYLSLTEQLKISQ
jgi:hypothetical protein